MKDTINQLEIKFKELSEKSKRLDDAMDAMTVVDFDEVDTKRQLIDNIRKQLNKAQKQRQAVLDAISALQEVCEHQNSDGSSAFRHSGNDSHYSYEKCGICGKEIKT